MATNLVSEIVKVLSPTIVSSIASSLGLNQTSTQKAIAGAVPALLAALMSSLSKPQGATKLSDAVGKQDPGLLSNLAGMLGGSGQKSLIDQGASALSSLLGGKISSALSGAVGDYAGITGSNAKSLMGLLGPVVLGVLGQEKRDQGLDASGLADLLTAQKSNIVGALPSGFAKYLGDTGILDDVTEPNAKRALRPVATPPSVIPWLLGALVLLGLVLLWRVLAPHKEQVVETKPSAPVETTTPVQADQGADQINATYDDLLTMLRGVKVGDVDVGDLANNAIGGLRSSLEGIKDEASAQAGLSALTKAQSEFDQLSGLLGQLTPEKRKILADLFVSVRPSLEQLLDKALAIPGVSGVIKPAVDVIRSKLDTLAKL